MLRELGRVGQATLRILVVAIAGGTTLVYAQAPTLPASAAIAAAAETDTSAVRLFVGRSTILDVGNPIARVSLTSADVADALVTSASQLLINGKAPGTISMFVWDRAGAVRRYEVSVQRDLSKLGDQMRELFPGERITVQSNGKNVVLSGSVSNKDVMEKAVSVAAGYVASREEVVTLLQLQAGAPSNQVLLKVRFAEVSRSGLMELGASFAANGYNDGRWYGRTTTGQFAAPEWDASGGFVFSDFLNLFLFDTKNQLAGVIKALQNKGLFQSLAEPNLVAESGKEASFLAGGEFPIPIAQGSGANIGVSVMFKEFGIRLNFTPTVNGNRVHLKVRPEVSTLDFNNAVTLGGFRIPALSTRRTETELELNNGQTFAIAGLLSNNLRSTLNKIPGIGNIPILGLLFTSKAAQKEQTELVVMITPHILPNNSFGVTNELPRNHEQFMAPEPERRTTPQPPAAYTPERSGVARPSTATPVAQTAAPSSPAATSALAPSAPRVVPAAPATAPAVPVAPQRPAANSASTAPSAAPTESATRPLTKDEQKTIDRARKQDEERVRREAQAHARAQAIEGRRLAEQETLGKKNAEEQRKKDEKLAREQASRDAEAAKKQAELDREHKKAVDAAAAKLKAAEAQYQAELEKRNSRNQR